MATTLKKKLKNKKVVTLREFKCDECGYAFWTEDHLISLYCPKCGKTVYYTKDLSVSAKS
jgi:ribosomal protein S27AE